MPRKNHPEKRKPSQKKMRQMNRREIEREKRASRHAPYPMEKEGEYGF